VRHPYFQKTLVLEEIQMPQALDLRVMYGMLTCDSSIGKPGACDKVQANIELPLSLIEVNTSNVPGSRYAEGGVE
jgi:hypothetical protein